jgi:hypothetical protein
MADREPLILPAGLRIAEQYLLSATVIGYLLSTSLKKGKEERTVEKRNCG